MPSVKWNESYWGADYEWTGGGEEWSEPWGGSPTQWWATIFPRISHALPTHTIVEIGSGHGRWTRFLLGFCKHYVGLDLAGSCVETGDRTFSQAVESGQARFVQGDGYKLAGIGDGSCDFVFSFDSLVHVDQDVMASYLDETMRVLRHGGRGFFHHSNVGMFDGDVGEYSHERGQDVSAESVRRAARSAGLACLVQEMVSWKTAACGDCFTLVANNGEPERKTAVLYNAGFWSNTDVIRSTIARYGGRG